MSTMGTFSGRRFDPLMMTPEDVVLEDIAHALSLLCRGGGQLKYFYSVGQHCINCMKEAKARGWSKRMQLACLIHDASEAYISDIIRPVKVHLSNYMEIEERIMDKIWRRFGLDDLTEEENRRVPESSGAGRSVRPVFCGAYGSPGSFSRCAVSRPAAPSPGRHLPGAEPASPPQRVEADCGQKALAEDPGKEDRYGA